MLRSDDYGVDDAERFTEARRLIAESAAAGIVLSAKQDELICGPRSVEKSEGLLSRLAVRKNDVLAELSRPRFTKTARACDSVRVPAYMIPWWSETKVNHVLANVTHVAWRVRGNECANRFRSALDAAVMRHELLTARVVVRDESLYLKFAEGWTIITAAAVGIESEQLRAVEAIVWAPFEDGSVFRPFVLTVSENEVLCGFVLHHFAADFHACQVLARELYVELVSGQKMLPGRAARPFQCSDYLRGMADFEAGPAVRYRLQFWRHSMRAAPPICLPNGAEIDTNTITALRSAEFGVSVALRSGLVATARSCAATLAQILMAAKFMALSKTLAQSDVVVIALVSGRDDPALLQLVGNTADCVPLRLRLRPQVRFADLLAELQTAYALACRYRLKWEMLWETFEEIGASTLAPTFNFVSGIRVQSAQRDVLTEVNRTSLQLLPVRKPPERGSASRYLSHEMNLFDTGLLIRGHVKYAPARYHNRTIESFIECFTTCLGRIVTDPMRTVGDIMAN